MVKNKSLPRASLWFAETLTANVISWGLSWDRKFMKNCDLKSNKKLLN